MFDDDSDSDQDNDNVGLLTGEIELGTLSPRQRNRSRPTRKKGRSTSKQRPGEPMPVLRLSQPKGATATDGNNNSNNSSNSSDEGPDLTGDYGNVALLLLLYTLQGIPMGLTAAVSLVLSANNVSLTQQNMFALVSWPFSLKLLWAPIVDAVFVPQFGRRKTWLIPTQLIIAGTIVYASPSIETWMASDALNGGVNDVFKLTCVFFMLFLMCATQDICVDGWALTLLQKRNVGYASTCNAIGQTLGNALAYIGWNVLTKYTDVTFGTFMMVWGMVFASVTVGVMLLKKEKDVSVENEPPSYREAYKEMMDILKIPLVQKLIVLLITCKVGFSSEAMSQIMMTGTVGMPRGDWVSLVLFLTVPSLIVPKLVERYTTGK
jgi:PAT family acetyl-CoA transporter-like MFS transporter 1